MAEQTQTNVAETETKSATSPVEDLRARFEKTGRVVFSPGDDMTILQELLSQDEETRGFAFKDWTGKAPENFAGVALVETKDEGEVRLIAFPPMSDALADPVVQQFAYERYIRAVIRTARDAESSEGQFITVSGALSVPYDNDAFAFQAEAWVNILHSKGLKSIRIRSLKNALMNKAWAESLFPTFKDWDKLLQLMAANAEKHGKSPAIFAHWAATREGKPAGDVSVSLGDDSLEKLLADADDDEKDEAAA